MEAATEGRPTEKHEGLHLDMWEREWRWIIL